MMAFSRGVPMPHSEGCPGHSHGRAGDRPCPAYRAERTRRKQQNYQARRGDCDCCGKEDVPVTCHDDKPLCRRCYNRWQQHGFTGPGPGPERAWAIETAREHASVIWGMSAPRAADNLGVSSRSIVRYRKLLREAS